MNDGRLFWATAASLLAFRVWLAAAFPFTGDEAYFYWWGKHPDWGFYDHPPMVGWWLAALIPVAETPGWLRLPQVFLPLVLALAVRALWPRLFPALADRRDVAALGCLAAPVAAWNVFITTDTPLVFFAVLSGLAWLRAAQDDDWRWYFAAGALLAGAVLSKYFAALMGFAFLVDAFRRGTRGAWRGVLIAYAACLPALILMGWWNTQHCWANYLFNFVNRHDAANTRLNATTPLLYLATLAYCLLPLLPWLFRRMGRDGRSTAGREGLQATLGILAWTPLALFAALSLYKKIGLHWLLAFLPFAYAWLIVRLPAGSVSRLARTIFAVAAAHGALILAGSRLPLEAWQRFAFYPSLVLTVEGRQLAEKVAKGNALLAADGYSNAVTLAYQLRRYVPVLGPGSGHARHDDLLTDWRRHDGKDFVVLRKTAPDPAELARYRQWFSQAHVEDLAHRGARFWLIRGSGFRYAAYRDDVLEEVRRRYYAIPAWLPLAACYFCDRYFPERACRR